MKTAGLVLCGIVFAAVAQDKSARLVCSFETPAEVESIKAAGAKVRRVAAHATDGRYALEARFEAVEESRIDIPVRSGDWSGYGSVILDAANTSREPVMFSVAVLDQVGAGTVGRTWWEIKPGEKASFALSLNSPPPMQMGMEGEPPVGDFRILRADHRPVDLARIASVRISMNKLPGPRTVVFDNFRLGPAVSYEKIVDRFGQYAKADWPGKVKSEADLKAQLADEQAELKTRPAFADRDEYGGWAAGPKLEATGYFRTVKRDGKWWLVTPSGHLFFSLGIDTVTASSSTRIEGREQMFDWVPREDDPLAAHLQTVGGRRAGAGSNQPSRRAFNFYAANLERKYGKDWYASWQAMALARLKAWGFNTVGNWSDRNLYGLKKAPYVGTLSIRGEIGRFSNVPPFPSLVRVYDTFDPRFPEAVEQSVRAAVEERRNDPWLIGYFVDNELNWGFMRNDRTRYALALEALSVDAASPARRAFVQQLEARYGSIEKLNAAWKARLVSWEELRQKPYRYESDLTPAAREDMGAFVKELAVRYFRTIRDTLKKYDPNHLYLGARFAWLVREDYAWSTQEVEEAAVQYCDVIGFNVYLPQVDARWDFLKRLDKPAIIGEFNFGAPDRGMFYPGVLGTSSQTERGRMYQEYVRSVMNHPNFVGCHFFEYGDEPLTGRGDGENFNTGFVTVTDSVYPEMVAAAKAVHAEVYRVRGARTRPHRRSGIRRPAAWQSSEARPRSEPGPAKAAAPGPLECRFRRTSRNSEHAPRYVHRGQSALHEAA